MAIILAIGAHYDDVELGVGGTLLKHVKAGDEVFIAVTDSDEYRTGDVSVRYQEQLKAINVLGIDKEKLLLFKTNDDIPNIVGALDDIKADVVYAMFESDSHQDHRKCSYIGQAVSRKLDTQVMFYNSGTSYDFLPNIFSIISFDFKNKLLACFKSQVELNIINNGVIQRREAYWGTLITKDSNSYAEGFMVRNMRYKIGDEF